MKNKFWLGFSSPAQILLVVGVWALVFVGAFLCATIKSAPPPTTPARIIRIRAKCVGRHWARPIYVSPTITHKVI